MSHWFVREGDEQFTYSLMRHKGRNLEGVCLALFWVNKLLVSESHPHQMGQGGSLYQSVISAHVFPAAQVKFNMVTLLYLNHRQKCLVYSQTPYPSSVKTFYFSPGRVAQPVGGAGLLLGSPIMAQARINQ